MKIISPDRNFLGEYVDILVFQINWEKKIKMDVVKFKDILKKTYFAHWKLQKLLGIAFTNSRMSYRSSCLIHQFDYAGYLTFLI